MHRTVQLSSPLIHIGPIHIDEQSLKRSHQLCIIEIRAVPFTSRS